MTWRHGCRPTMRSTGRHSHSNFKTFMTQIKILMWQINGESLLKAVLLDLFGLLKSNYLYVPCGLFSSINAILSQFPAALCARIPNVYKQIIGLLTLENVTSAWSQMSLVNQNFEPRPELHTAMRVTSSQPQPMSNAPIYFLAYTVC